MAGKPPEGHTPREIYISFSSSHMVLEERMKTMHVELGALSELHLEVSRGDLVHELSPVSMFT